MSPDTGPTEPAGEAAGVLPARVVALLRSRRESLAVAESLTGGDLCGTLVAVPGCSAVFRGGLVAYAPDLKARLLGVDAQLLATTGAVDTRVAQQMATGARRLLAADWAVATTGVAGPAEAGGRSPGTVHVAVVGPATATAAQYHLPGGRAEVRAGAVAAAVAQLAVALAGAG